MKTLLKTLSFGFTMLLASTININAQSPLTFGVKGGITISDYSNDIKNNGRKIGYNAGVTVDYQFSRYFYILSGLEVATKGSKIKDLYPSDEAFSKIKEKYDPIYLQIPLHAGYTLRAAEDAAILFHGGPYLSYGVGGDITVEKYSNEGRARETYDAFGSKGVLNRWDFGIGLGIGFEHKGIAINFGYDLGILDIYKGEPNVKNNTANLSFAYRFRR